MTSPEDIQVDSHNIYWTDPATNEVWQADKVSFARTLLASNQAKPWRLAVDPSTVYWTSNQGGWIVKTPIGGGPVTHLYSAASPTGIAIDTGNVYWSDDGTMQLYKAPLTPGVPMTLYHGLGSTADVMRVDAQNVYAWEPVDAEYMIVGKVPGNVFSYVLASGFYHVYGAATAGGRFYYGAYDAVRQVDWIVAQPTGSTQVPFSHAPQALDADVCNVYWSDGQQNIWAMIGVGGVPRIVTSAAKQSHHVAIDEAYVYWTDSSGFIGRAAR